MFAVLKMLKKIDKLSANKKKNMIETLSSSKLRKDVIKKYIKKLND